MDSPRSLNKYRSAVLLLIGAWTSSGFDRRTSLLRAGLPTIGGTGVDLVRIEALMRTFRELFLGGLETLFLEGKLELDGVLHKAAENAEAFCQWLEAGW